MNKENISRLKLEGFINQRDKKYFSMRIIVVAGKISTEEMENILSIANKYGRGYISFTTRLSIEIPWIKEEDIQAVKKDIAKYNLQTGGTGKKIRPIVSCKGTICMHGLIDTQGIAKKLHESFFAYELPAKFKIGIVGCPNNCAKAQLNDIGIMGQKIPGFEKDECKLCGACASVCKVSAIEKTEKGIILNEEKCIGCGKCIEACKFNAMVTKNQGTAIFMGGKFGRKYRIGNRVHGIFQVNDLESIIQNVLKYFAQNASSGERFGDMIDRIGFEEVLKGCSIVE